MTVSNLARINHIKIILISISINGKILLLGYVSGILILAIRVLVLAGPTAVGKTALAIEWARRFDGEILGADSRQIYRMMDIGTAKPSPDEQAAAPHHLINKVMPDESLTLAEYQAAAYARIADVAGRGKLPILTGGTGLYITAVLEGWQAPEIPPNPTLRAELEAMSNAALFAQLRELDPATAATIDPNNPRRLVRAVEVCLVSGQPFSEQRRKNPPDYDVLPFALTLPREELYARADARLDTMIAAGWLDETADLIQKGFGPPMPSMSALGYPQMIAVLRGEITLETAREQIKRATRSFIRRQYTWLRGHDAGWRWLESSQSAENEIAAWLSDESPHGKRLDSSLY